MTADTGKLTTIRARMAGMIMALALVLCGAVQAAEAPLETAMDAVLTVRSNDAQDKFLGSAFLWGEDALVAVTNAHVVGDADEVRLIDRYGNTETGTVIARDALRDVAVISVAPGRRGLVAAADPAGLGLEVFALGAPLGIEFTLTEGLISATARQVEIAVPLLFLQHDAAVNPGSSGGPLVDADGRLLGMNSQIADGSRVFVGIAYAIAAGDLVRIVDGLIAETLAPFPTLGMTARPLDRKTAEALGVETGGLLVDAVVKGGLAEAAGLLPGDIIRAVDGQDLTDPGVFAFAIEAAVAVDTAALSVQRGAETVTLALVLTASDVVDGGIKIKTRDISAAEPERIKSYRLGALGVILGDDARVTGVTDNSPALYAGLAQGDRIVSVNGQALDTAALETLEITGPVVILVQAPGGTTRHLYLDPWGRGDGVVRPKGGANVLDPAVTVF